MFILECIHAYDGKYRQSISIFNLLHGFTLFSRYEVYLWICFYLWLKKKKSSEIRKERNIFCFLFLNIYLKFLFSQVNVDENTVYLSEIIISLGVCWKREGSFPWWIGREETGMRVLCSCFSSANNIL